MSSLQKQANLKQLCSNTASQTLLPKYTGLYHHHTSTKGSTAANSRVQTLTNTPGSLKKENEERESLSSTSVGKHNS